MSIYGEHFQRNHFVHSDKYSQNHRREIDKVDTHMSSDTFGGNNLTREMSINTFNKVAQPSPIKSTVSDASKSKSYILAMKTLQQKLEQKEKNITELEKIVQEQKLELDHVRSLYQDSVSASQMPTNSYHKLNHIRKVETAKFGIKNSEKLAQMHHGQNQHLDFDVKRLNFDVDGYYADENVHPNTGQVFRPSHERIMGQQISHQTMEVSVLISSIKKLESLNSELKNDNCELAREMQDMQHSLDLSDSKIQIAREQNQALNHELDQASRKIVDLEGEVRHHLKESSRLKAAIKNLEELVGILSKGKPTSYSTAASTCIQNKASLEMTPVNLKQSKQSNHSKDLFSLESTKITQEFQNNSSSAEKKNASSKVVPEFGNIQISPQSPLEGGKSVSQNDELVLDIVNHVLINQELTLQHLDLFNHMKDRLLEDKIFFDSLESNYQYLKYTKDALLNKQEEMNESYVNDRVETDLSTIENLLGVIRGFLTLKVFTMKNIISFMEENKQLKVQIDILKDSLMSMSKELQALTSEIPEAGQEGEQQHLMIKKIQKLKVLEEENKKLKSLIKMQLDSNGKSRLLSSNEIDAKVSLDQKAQLEEVQEKQRPPSYKSGRPEYQSLKEQSAELAADFLTYNPISSYIMNSFVIIYLAGCVMACMSR